MRTHVQSTPLVIGELPLSLTFTFRSMRRIQELTQGNTLEWTALDWLRAVSDPGRLPEILVACLPESSAIPIGAIIDAIGGPAEIEAAQMSILRAKVLFEGADQAEADRRMAGLQKAKMSSGRGLLQFAGLTEQEIDTALAAPSVAEPDLDPPKAMAV